MGVAAPVGDDVQGRKVARLGCGVWRLRWGSRAPQDSSVWERSEEITTARIVVGTRRAWRQRL
jgi:hypothetical protein